MKQNLFFLIPTDDQQPIQWFGFDENEQLKHGDLTADSHSDQASFWQNRTSVAIIPGGDVVATSVTLPSRKKRHVEQALPFATEEQLASPVEQIHIAKGTWLENNELAVYLVEHQRMEAYLERLGQYQVQPDWLVPDYLCLPSNGDSWQLVIEQQAICRQDQYRGFATDPEHLATLLNALTSPLEGDEKPQLQVNNFSQSAVDYGELKPVIQTENPSYLQLLASHWYSENCTNLRQGDYSKRRSFDLDFGPWRAVAMVAAIALASFLTTDAVNYFQLKSHQEQLDQAIEKTFFQAMPNSRRMVDPRSQINSRLAELSGTGSGSQFISLLAKVSDSLARSSDLTIERINYRNETIDMALTAKSIQAFEQLKTELQQQGVAIEVLSAQSRDGVVNGKIRIKG